MYNELISIIVPVFNVENYLTKCVKSLIKQTYRKIEILLIDDGSTDKCGEICDKFSLIDSRIKVYHKKNGGLSDARNYGVTKAKGKYIFFLDSDDYIKLDAIEILYINMKKYNSDISIANFCYYYNDNNIIENFKSASDFVYFKQEAMQELIKDEYLNNFAWGKLYKKELIKNLLFPINKWFEDIYWMHLVIDKANKIVISNEILVFYRQRNDSISYSRSLKKIDLLDGYLTRRDFLKCNYPNLLQNFDLSLYKIFKEVSMLFFFSTNFKNSYIFYKYIKNVNKKYRDEFNVYRKNNINFLFKMKFLLKYPILFNVSCAILKCFRRR